MAGLVLPNEILDKIFLMSSSVDIRIWESYERLSKITFMKKKHSNLVDACREGNILGVRFLVERGC